MGQDDDGHSVALLYAKRVAGLASELERCHALGVVPGQHDAPWELGFQRRAVPIYLETLPIEYLSDLGAGFDAAADGLEILAASLKPSGELSDGWGIAYVFMRNSAVAIAENSVSAGPAPIVMSTHELEPTMPSVMRFDLLAALVSLSGAQRLGRAAKDVIVEIEQSQRPFLDDEAVQLLRGLVAGKSVVDLATQIGRSERQTYRTLNDVWATLGVNNRRAGLVRAAELGYLDDAT